MRYSSELKLFFNREKDKYPFKLFAETDRSVMFSRRDGREWCYICVFNTSSHYYRLFISSSGITFPSLNKDFYGGFTALKYVIEAIRSFYGERPP